MSKISLQDIASGYNLQTVVNNNNAFIEEAFDNTLSRDGSSPNEMSAPIDMNSNPIINLGAPVGNTSAARWIDLTDSVNVTGIVAPALSGNDGKYLGTDGTSTTWSYAPVRIPLSLKESIAGLSNADIFDYTKDPGNVLRYGTDQAAIQKAEAYCVSSGDPIKGEAITVTLTSTLVLRCKGDLSMMTVQCNSANFSPAVRVGLNSTASPTLLDGELRLPRVVNSSYVAGAGWATFQVGVDLANLYQASIFIPEIVGFDTGVWAGGYDSGFSYNHVDIRMLTNNKVNFRLGGKAATGWANQNTIRLDRCFINSSEGSNIPGARYIQLAPFNVASNDLSWPNGNTIIGASVELVIPEYQLEIAGNNNIFLGLRFEAAGTPKVKLTGHASVTLTYENMIIGGYQASSIQFTKSGIVSYTSVLNPRISSFGGSGSILNLKNEGSGGDPLIQGFTAGSIEHLNRDNSATDWSVRLSATNLSGKQPTDANPRFDVDLQNGVIKTGSGVSAPSQVVGVRSTGWTAMTGTANSNTSYDTTTVTLAQLAGRVKALQDALNTHGLIGI